jgi:hypothetical protein
MRNFGRGCVGFERTTAGYLLPLMLTYLKGFINVLVVLMIFALLALGIATIALQLPSVQTYAVQTVAGTVSEKLGYPISIEKVNIKWFDVVSLEGISVKDLDQRDMIDVGRIDVNLDFYSLLENASREIHLDEVNLYRPNVHLVVVPDSGYLNIDGFIERISELTSSGVPRPPDAPENNTPFTIGKSRVTDGTFRYDDPREVRRKGARIFDYSHFELYKLNGELKNFLAQGDTISFLAKNLTTVDRQTGLTMKDLQTRFLFCQKKMELKALKTHIGNSYLTDDISFHYNRSGDLGDFNHKVFLRARFRGSHIHSRDLGLFSEYVDKLDETWRLSGDFNGKVDDFKLTDADIYFGKGSRLLGSLGFKGFPKLEGAIMDIRLSLSKVEPEDIVQYYPEAEVHETLEKFGLTLLEGSFKGTVDDFAVNASASSNLGKVSGDLVFNISDAKNTSYSGMLKTSDFELGTFLEDDKTWQKLDFSGNIHGRGTTLQHAFTDMDAVVNRVGFKEYNYRNIRLRGNLQNQYFNGLVNARDSNFVVNLEGEFDLSRPKNLFDVKGVVERANLNALGFSKDTIILHTEMNVQVEGNNPDELTGTAKLLNTYLRTSKLERNLVVDTLVLSSSVDKGRRKLFVGSEFLTARAEGDFLPTEAYKDLSQVLKEYKLYFLENEANRAEYYSRKTKKPVNHKYEVDYRVETKNMSRFLAFISPDVYISHGAVAEGIFKMDNTAIITFNAKADTTRYGKNEFVKSEVDVTTSKFVNGAEVLASALVISQKQQISVLVPTEKLELEGTWDVDHIEFNGGLRQVGSSNRALLAGEIQFLASGIDIGFKNSKLNLLEEEWKMPSNSLIEIAGKELTFSNLGLVNGSQVLSVNGLISENPDRNLQVEIRNFKLATLNTVLNTKLAGIMDGSAKLRDVYNNVVLDAGFNIEGLGYGKYEFGNLGGSGEWDQFAGQLVVAAELSKNARKVFNLTGSYNPTRNTNSLNLKAVFNQVDLKGLEPFAEELVSDISGTAQGVVLVKGVVDAPLLSGSLLVDKGRMKFDYLQSVFTFNDKVNFSESEISVNNMLLTDSEGNTATLRGGVFHDGFKYFTLGFNADLRNFKILNTTAKDNTRFYGTALVTGQASIYGPIDNLKIEANATSNKGTKMYIPLDGATEVDTQDYIQFVSKLPPVDSSSTETDELKSRTAGGIKMDFNFSLTPDASCEIILDRQTGDIIRAFGRGRLNMNIDTEGDFTMTGTYEIDRGDYNFTLQNVINKKFVIKPGSRITWSGDPYGAQLNVTAGYTQMVSLAGVLPATNVTSQRNEALLRRYPVEVIIGLSEGLMTPQIKYDLKILDNASLTGYRGQIEAFQSRLKADEQELSLQVSSLLVMNQLQPESSLSGQLANQNFLGNSISELVSNQISQWASKLNENLEVGVTGLSLDQNALNNLQLRFSYRFLNDRFRVTRDGRINNGITSGGSQYDATSLLGEWTLEYWLTPNGSVRAKAYNRNIQNALILSPTVTTGGFSFQFTHSFNRFAPMPKPTFMPIPFVIPPDSSKVDSSGSRLISREGPTR